MRAHVASAATLACLLLAGCDQGGDEGTVTITESSPTSPGSAPTSEPTDDTTAPTTASPESPARVVDTIVTGLEVPWGVAFLPDGDAVVTERDSRRVLLIGGGDHEVTVVGTIEDAVPQGEAGLLGVAVSPEFATDSALYFYVSTLDDNRVVTATLERGRLGPTEPIFTGIPNGFIHDGGRMVFGPDGYLYVSTGESGDPPLAQDRDSLGGKILRLTPEGEPAPGNPFGTAIWSWGHRNVQGLAFDGNRLWASEFGQDRFDELNLIRPGDNYGWPEVEGEGGTGQGFVDPLASWSTDEASPSGLAYVDGSLWMAALRGERLWQVQIDGPDVTRVRDHFIGEYGRMRTVVVAPDGRLWVTTSNRDGRGEPAADDDRILLIEP